MRSLDVYEAKPKDMIRYLSYYGWHFNKKMCQFALKQLHSKTIDKDKVDTLLSTYNIELENNYSYDYVYVANYGLVYYLKSSIPDEKCLAQYIKDTIDKQDSELAFTQWYASMCRLGIPIDWEDML